MSEAAVAADQTRQGVGLFPIERGLIRVTGRDRVRWLNGMISADVAILEPGPTRSGCYALLLTPKGSIVADLHVLYGEESLRLELDAAATRAVIERLGRYVISEDVTLADVSGEVERFALEGPRALELLADVGVSEASGLGPDAWLSSQIGSTAVDVAAWGTSGERAFQLFVPVGEGASLQARLEEAGASLGLTAAGSDALELLRIEAGVPRLGAELDEDVLPAEARLVARAVSLTKGCYTGQEIVARIESRGQVNHLLVGLAFEPHDALPDPGTPLLAPDAGDKEPKPIGEVTSVGLSARCGAIGLGYVRRALAGPGTLLAFLGGTARVAELPFIAPASD